jgi:ketosteroid isomerase-like protein
MQNDNFPIMERFKSAVVSGDWVAVATLADSDFTLYEPAALPYGGVHEGVEGFRSCLQKIKATFATISLQHIRTYVTNDADHVVGEFVVHGKVIATGAEYTSAIFERWDFRNRKVLGITVCWFDIPIS